jgi:hypothetical protein
MAGTQPFDKFFSKPDLGGGLRPPSELMSGLPKPGFENNFSKGWVPARGHPIYMVRSHGCHQTICFFMWFGDIALRFPGQR